MSVKKINFSYIKKNKTPFTTLLNDVIQNINNAFHLGLYVYLYSLPPGWLVNKQHLMTHFNVGRDKLNSALTWLHDNFLMTYEQERNNDGTISKWSITILDGIEFIDKIVKPSTTLKTSIVDIEKSEPIDSIDNSPSIHYTEKPVTGKSAPINKTKKGRDVNKFVLPDWISKDLWDNFENYRKEIKAPLTTHAKIIAINRLAKFKEKGQNPEEIIEEAILNRWRGLFPLRSSLNSSKNIFISEPQKNRYSHLPDWTADRLAREQ